MRRKSVPTSGTMMPLRGGSIIASIDAAAAARERGRCVHHLRRKSCTEARSRDLSRAPSCGRAPRALPLAARPRGERRPRLRVRPGAPRRLPRAGRFRQRHRQPDGQGADELDRLTHKSAVLRVQFPPAARKVRAPAPALALRSCLLVFPPTPCAHRAAIRSPGSSSHSQMNLCSTEA